MENQTRRPRMLQIQDQENVTRHGGKNNIFTIPTKRVGLSVRGPLGELNSNVQAQRDVNIGKVAVAAAEFEKKATSTKGIAKCYSHVTSKVDTGLAVKLKEQSSRPVFRREESTTGLTTKAVARTRAALKDQLKSNDQKENVNSLRPTKKTGELKRTVKLPTVKEIAKEDINKAILKPILKEPTESLGKLKLDSAPLQNNTRSNEEIYDVKLSELPNDIEDIDASDKESPLLMSMYIKDIYRYLTELEVKYPVEPDFLKKQSVITGKMRATLIDWLVEVQRQFSLLLETFHLTVGIIDRYLQVVPNLQRNQLQLVGVTAMLIASKYEEIYAPNIDDFVYVTANAYSKDEIFSCERDILSKLGFCLARPIPLSFLRRFVKAAHGTSKNHHLAKYLVDLALVDYTMAHYRPSELAAAAICLSLHLLSNKTLEHTWTPTLSHYSGYNLSHIKPIMMKLAKIVTNVENSKYKAVSNKYQDTTLAKVACLPHLKGEGIKKLLKDTSSP